MLKKDIRENRPLEGEERGSPAYEQVRQEVQREWVGRLTITCWDNHRYGACTPLGSCSHDNRMRGLFQPCIHGFKGAPCSIPVGRQNDRPISPTLSGYPENTQSARVSLLPRNVTTESDPLLPVEALLEEETLPFYSPLRYHPVKTGDA